MKMLTAKGGLVEGGRTGRSRRHVILARLGRTSREQRKLLFSLSTNFATRIPGAIGVLWFLPLLRFGLGTDDYSSLLGAMALGSAATFLIGGFSLVGRRLIGEAYAAGDHAAEANGFVGLCAANFAAIGLALAIIGIYCSTQDSGLDVLVVAMIPAVAVFLTMFDNVRSAYNEHYVTALLQLVLQIAVYTIGFLVPATQHHLVFAALVLQSHMILASLISLGLLLRDRSYLMSGRASDSWRIMREGTMVAMADSAMTTTLSLSVVWLQASASAATSAWFATTVRLFQTFLVPVILLVIPLSSYIRIRWNSKTVAQQQAFAKATLGFGLGYGAVVGVALFVASHLYVDRLLHLPAPGDAWRILPSFVLFGAIIAWKSYSAIAFVVLDDPSHLSSWTTAAIGGAVILGAAASLEVDPLSVINIYALAAGLSIIVVLIWSAGRFIWPTPNSPQSG